MPSQWEPDQGKMEACRKVIARQMLDAGWNRLSAKFDEVCRRKALKLYYARSK